MEIQLVGRYEVFRRKYELDSEYGSVLSWKEKIKMRNMKDWVEEVKQQEYIEVA